MANPTIPREQFRYVFTSDEYTLRGLPPGDYEIKRSEDNSMMFIKIGNLWFNCTP